MRIWFSLMLTGLCACARAERITLVRDGRPAATIVLPAGAPEWLEEAAAELQRCVRKISGVELPIRRDGRAVGGTGLYIGRCAPSLPADPPDAARNPESYAIRPRDGSVFFAGRYPTPTYFAVVSFIEEALGVRWFAPGAAWEYLPPGKPGERSIRSCHTPRR